ncbi:SGNH/GDSL hydrolase family protein [Amycolatopsis endophytica]|uniref:Lysophospholipase L1-like esterase n=1 Tax=Amycolatopsis endophytica TaxID=860233 RepID=A0A853B9C5_9PSEU|nr:SGNH/GDSL hydrolase family protein [Amycolatopsis endophytica]NYI91301.1 lysophospholipase L1-like esterase [Amycolatopsis endophytica]
MPPRRLGATLAATVTTVAAVLSAAPAAHADSLEYVALGDSYSAASGVQPSDPDASPLCLRSSLNYPHVIAAETGASLTDVTCGAAETRHFTAAQYPGVPPQVDALGADTDVVTMTIGGNDSGVFISAILACGSAGILALGQGSPCHDIYGSYFEDTIRDTTYPALVSALEAVRDKAPAADVAILGYPWILPATTGCFDKMPVADGDVPYLRGLQATLNDAVGRAAEATGVTYVDMSEASEGHDACQAPDVRWIEPVLQGSNPVVVHPNAQGEAAMAGEAMDALGLS